MQKSAFIILAMALLATAPPAAADLRVSFQESAPKDRFSIVNAGGCDLTDLTLTIDLTPSAGGLIFDTEPTGAGVEVYQPFEIVEGLEHVQSIDTAADGGRTVTILFSRLAPNAATRFTVDVDDTLTNSALGQ
ncbi:MAG: aggregation factor core, partial [Pseudomonadota bacterium]